MINTRKRYFLFTIILIIFIAFISIIVYQYITKQKIANPDDSIFGKTEEEIAEIFDWNLVETERMMLSSEVLDTQSGNLSGYTLKLQNVELFGKTAQKVYLQFMQSDTINSGLTLLYAEYLPNENMDHIADRFTKIWGESRKSMYCSWADRIYLQDIWGDTPILDYPDSFSQLANDEKQLWGSQVTIGESLKGQENPQAIYEEWSVEFSRIYAQSLKNEWEDIEKEPLITAVLFRNCDEYQKNNTIILDGFNLLYPSINGKKLFLNSFKHIMGVGASQLVLTLFLHIYMNSYIFGNNHKYI